MLETCRLLFAIDTGQLAGTAGSDSSLQVLHEQPREVRETIFPVASQSKHSMTIIFYCVVQSVYFSIIESIDAIEACEQSYCSIDDTWKRIPKVLPIRIFFFEVLQTTHLQIGVLYSNDGPLQVSFESN